jgi:hypothetical protein
MILRSLLIRIREKKKNARLADIMNREILKTLAKTKSTRSFFAGKWKVKL